MAESQDACKSLPKIKKKFWGIERDEKQQKEMVAVVSKRLDNLLFHPLDEESATELVVWIMGSPEGAVRIMQEKEARGEKKLDSDISADDRTRDLMQKLERGDYATLVDLVGADGNMPSIQDGVVAIHLIQRAVDYEVSVMDYLNRVYGTRVSKKTIFSLPDGRKIELSQAIPEILKTRIVEMTQKDIKSLEESCRRPVNPKKAPRPPKVEDNSILS